MGNKQARQKKKNQSRAQSVSESLNLIEQIEDMSFRDCAYGSMMGVFIGDSCGSYLEFNRQRASEKEMDKAMTMCGGGPFKLHSGQITDDGEMSISLMLGLIDGKNTITQEGEEKNVLDLDKIAHHYKNWYWSNPFDIGSTVKGSFSALRRETEPRASLCKNLALQVNMESQSNGTMM